VGQPAVSMRSTNAGAVVGAIVPVQEPWSVQPSLEGWPGGMRLQYPESAVVVAWSIIYDRNMICMR
jgi:hypothetical protein